MSNFIRVKQKYYILASSSLADDRTMVLKDGECFGVLDRYGDVFPIGQGAQGLYHEGTRMISKMELLVEGQRPLILSSGLKEENELLTVDLTNPDYYEDGGKFVEKGTIHIHRTKFLWKNVCYEEFRICNFGLEPVNFNLSMVFHSDFKDIFEVRGIERKKTGQRFKAKENHDEISFSYKGLDAIKRTSRIRFKQAPTSIKNKKAEFFHCLLPKACETIEITIAFEEGNKKPEVLNYALAHTQLQQHLEMLRSSICKISSSSEQFNEWIERSRADIATMISNTPSGLYPYAGIPWYSTPFGRDGIITAWEFLWMDPSLCKNVLNFLAETQAKELNDFQDAEPGKIFHETRGGEMAATGEIPFKMYYGTIDATPLFIGLAGSYYERTGDLDFIKKIWPNIEAALDWIDNYGDSDGDGFVEYSKKSDKGLVNQGWKDSHDSVFHEDGNLAVGPIALCEVQGYVYDAKIKASRLASILGDFQKAEKLTIEAEKLKENFAEAFWIPEKGCFAIALDGNKRPCRVVNSNAGHCLFSGIVKPEHAKILAKSLMKTDMFSGWGIRTIAETESKYNPMSYHNGSIWPHDNAMIALGLARYGYMAEASKVMEGMFDVSMFVEAHRLPELFCGFDKRKNEGPTAYPVACSPQAWAVGTVYMLIQACLGLRIIAEENKILLCKPILPSFLHEITIGNLHVNGNDIVLQVRRLQDGRIVVEPLRNEGGIIVELNYEYSELEEYSEIRR